MKKILSVALFFAVLTPIIMNVWVLIVEKGIIRQSILAMSPWQETVGSILSLTLIIILSNSKK